MQKLLRVLRITALILLIVLASTGMGLTGAAPVLPKNREQQQESIDVESEEKEQTDTESVDEMQQLH